MEFHRKVLARIGRIDVGSSGDRGNPENCVGRSGDPTRVNRPGAVTSGNRPILPTSAI